MAEAWLVRPVLAEAVDEQLIRELAERARSEGLEVTGEGGLLARPATNPASASTTHPGALLGVPVGAAHRVVDIDPGDLVRAGLRRRVRGQLRQQPRGDAVE